MLGSRLDYVMVGIGINVNMKSDFFKQIPYAASSLLVELGRPVDRLVLLVGFLERLEGWYGLFG